MKQPIRGRGAAGNPANRFERLEFSPEPEDYPDEQTPPNTIFLRDTSRTIIARNNSPDIPFEASINPYRGCEHGCIYCYARPTHEYLGFSAGLDFETKIVVKENAPELLRGELMSARWKPQVLSMSGVTDCYQPIERSMKLTRRCLQVLAEFMNPVAVISKNHLITRDADILSRMAERDAAAAFVTITTLDNSLQRTMEPRTSHPAARLRAIETLTRAGVPVGVMVAPVIPGLTDSEIPEILKAAADAGALMAGYVPLRLPHAVAPLFEQWLENHAPLRKDKILNRVRAMRNGKLNDPEFGSRMCGEGIFADQIRALFETGCRKNELNKRSIDLSTESFRRPAEGQLSFL